MCIEQIAPVAPDSCRRRCLWSLQKGDRGSNSGITCTRAHAPSNTLPLDQTSRADTTETLLPLEPLSVSDKMAPKMHGLSSREDAARRRGVSTPNANATPIHGELCVPVTRATPPVAHANCQLSIPRPATSQTSKGYDVSGPSGGMTGLSLPRTRAPMPTVEDVPDVDHRQPKAPRLSIAGLSPALNQLHVSNKEPVRVSTISDTTQNTARPGEWAKCVPGDGTSHARSREEGEEAGGDTYEEDSEENDQSPASRRHRVSNHHTLRYAGTNDDGKALDGHG